MTPTQRPEQRSLPTMPLPDLQQLERERAWLAAVAPRPWPVRQFAYLRHCGPGYLQSALTLGGGTASACLLSGAAFRYELLWVVPLGMLLGGIVFAAIAHQTLSTRMRPFAAMRTFAGPVFAWGWAIGTVVASVVWHFAQYSLASAVLVDLGAVVGLAVPRVLAGLCVLAWAVPTALRYGRGGPVQQAFTRLMRHMVWAIVLLFFAVAVRLGLRDPGAVVAGFVPHLPPSRGDVDATAVAIAGLATAVGVNMTFLYPYSLLARGWGKEHRELARTDIAFGMVLPYVLVTSLMVFVAAGTLAEGFSGKAIAPMEASKTLGELLGPVWGRVLFDLGLLAMLLSTIALHMVCAGLACAEMFGWPHGSRAHRLASLVPAPGVLGSLLSGPLSVWVAVPTSIVSFTLLPLAYLGFLKLQMNGAYLGADRPRGLRGALWIALLLVATIVPLVFLASYVAPLFTA